MPIMVSRVVPDGAVSVCVVLLCNTELMGEN